MRCRLSTRNKNSEREGDQHTTVGETNTPLWAGPTNPRWKVVRPQIVLLSIALVALNVVDAVERVEQVPVRRAHTHTHTHTHTRGTRAHCQQQVMHWGSQAWT